MQFTALSRRQVLQSATATAIGAAASPLMGADKRPPVCVYTEHFQSLPIPKVCELFAKMGVDGLDLTVRPGGHIDPREARAELPKAVEAARRHGLKIMMLTTAITTPDPLARDIITTCHDLGIDRIKLGYFRVGPAGTLRKRIAESRRQLVDLIEFTDDYRVLPCVHVHSGATIPSNGLMLFDLLRDLSPKSIGAYLDSHHMTLTGGAGGWRQAIELLQPWISLVALKNFQWEQTGRGELDEQQWRTNYCRLAEGVCPIPAFVRAVHAADYRGFYTLHTEYRAGVAECLKWTTEDFAFLRKVFKTL